MAGTIAITPLPGAGVWLETLTFRVRGRDRESMALTFGAVPLPTVSLGQENADFLTVGLKRLGCHH